MDFKQIEAFTNVVKYKGFSKAAEATYLTQPTISAHINALEKELNLQLIDRMRKEAVLTPEGRIFYNYALSILNMRSQAILAVQNFSLNINGTVELQASSIPGQYIVPRLMAAFKKEYPEVKFTLEQSDSRKVAENIRASKGEIGFTGVKSSDGLIYEPLMKDKPVLITPDQSVYREKMGRPVSLREMAEDAFVLREEGSGTRESFEQELGRHGIGLHEVKIAACMNNMEAIKQAVKGGVGVSVISEVAADRERNDNGYLVFDLADYQAQREFYIVYSGRITMSPTSETFRLFVMEAFA